MHSLFSYLSVILLLIMPFSISLYAQKKSVPIEQQKRDSLIQTYIECKSDSIDDIIDNLTLALQINTSFNNDTITAFCTNALAFCHRKKKNFKKAITYQKASLKTYQKIQTTSGITSSLNELGRLYKDVGKYESAIMYCLDGIDVAQNNNNEYLGQIYQNLAEIYLIKKKPNLSIKYLKTGLAIKNDSALFCDNYLNLGSAYKLKGNDSLSIVYYKKALNLCNLHHKTQAKKNTILINMYDALIRMGNAEEAFDYLFITEQYQEQNQLKQDLAHTYLCIAEAYYAILENENAITYAQKSVSLAKETQLNHQLLKSYLYLAQLLNIENRQMESLKFLLAHINLNDSLFSIDKAQYTEDLLAQFDVERRKNEIHVLKNEQTLQQKQLQLNKQELKNQMLIKNIAFLIAFCLLITAIMIVLFYKNKVRINHLKNIKKEEDHKRKILNLIKTHEINTIKSHLNGQEKERKRIAGELHDGIGGNLASIKMQLLKLTNNDNKQLKTIVKNVNNTYLEVRKISHNLCPIELSRGSFSSLIHDYIETFNKSGNLNIALNIFPDEKLNLIRDEIKIEIYRVIQESLNNITKHANANQVDIQLIISDSNLNLMVEDDGVGFNPSTTLSSGLGLKNIKSRIKYLNGKIDIDSAPGRGTIVNIDIPCLAKKLNSTPELL